MPQKISPIRDARFRLRHSTRIGWFATTGVGLLTMAFFATRPASGETPAALPATLPSSIQSAASPLPTSQPVYSETRPAADGIGKVYLGRQIAQVMGHEGASWLERRSRLEEEAPDRSIQLMNLKKTDVVADIGAGSGYFTFRMARLVPQGKVLAVDIQQEMLDLLQKRAVALKLPNVEMLLGTVTDPKLPPNAVDAVLMVDAYHEFDHPQEMMTVIARSLKPGGRVYLVEYRAEDPDVRIKPHHKMTEAQARLEMAAVGLEFVENKKDLPQQHFLIFQKPPATTRPATGPSPAASTVPGASPVPADAN